MERSSEVIDAVHHVVLGLEAQEVRDDQRVIRCASHELEQDQ